MKLLYRFALLLVFTPALFAQGVRMSADFLPLEVGNRWVYEVLNEDGKKIGDLDFSIQEHTIISGRSYYVVTRFPFVYEGGGQIKLLRYDRQERQYIRMLDQEEGPLFLADGASSEVLQTDDSGLPIKFVLHTDKMSLTFQRGIGIVEARVQSANGIQTVKIASARVGERRATETAGGPGGAGRPDIPNIPKPRTPEQKTKDLADNVTTITEENPMLQVEAVPVPGGHKFVLIVTNTSDKLLPFHFNTGQSYDFGVLDSTTGQEIWRWSRRMFFTQVIRSEAIRPGRQWKYEVVWNHRDNDLNPVRAGRYRLVGIVATQPPIESDPLPFEVK